MSLLALLTQPEYPCEKKRVALASHNNKNKNVNLGEQNMLGAIPIPYPPRTFLKLALTLRGHSLLNN